MDGDSWLRIIIFTACIFCGAYFAAAESAFSAMNRIRVKTLADDGDRNAKKALWISERFDRSLTALLIGINVTHIVCATMASVLSLYFWKDRLGEEKSATLATVITTVLVYFISELTPKCIAKANSEKVACSLAPSLRVIMVILTPFVLFFNGVSSLLLRFFPESNQPTYTEDELSDIIEVGEEEGIIDEDSSEILQSAIDFADTNVSEIMTVKEDIEGIDIRSDDDAVLEKIRNTKHSRLPVFSGDRVVGILLVRDYLRKSIKGEKTDLRKIMYKPLTVKENTPVHGLFDRMRNGRIYMAVVADEKGCASGIVTIEDFLEELVGEIWDEDDVVDESFIKAGGYNFDIDAKMNVGEAFDKMGYETSDLSVRSKTINAWMIEKLGHIPEEEESFEFENLTVECSKIENGAPTRVIISMNNEDGGDAQ